MAGEKIPDGTWQEKLIAEARLRQNEREKGYRAQALKIHPPICARCGREFAGKKLRELTVHHKDHNHENNPADGSNWELLCLYCHENEHSRNAVADAYDANSKRSLPAYSPRNKRAAVQAEAHSDAPPPSRPNIYRILGGSNLLFLERQDCSENNRCLSPHSCAGPLLLLAGFVLVSLNIRDKCLWNPSVRLRSV